MPPGLDGSTSTRLNDAYALPALEVARDLGRAAISASWPNPSSGQPAQRAFGLQ